MPKNNSSTNFDLPDTLTSTDSDLSNWLTSQGIRTETTEPTVTRPVGPAREPSPAPSHPENDPSTTGDGSYERRFLHRTGTPVRPTHMVHVSERVHRFFSFLAGYTQVVGARVSVPELIENLIGEHLLEHEGTIERLQQEFSRRNLKAF
jgi:hypothetical protein